MLIVGMLVKNEANRYLKEALDDISVYSDGIVILDNGSTDDTISICKSYSKLLNLEVDNTDFKIDELHLRRKLVEMCFAQNPDWILILDADEVMENKFKTELPKMMLNEENNWYSFSHHHFWGDKIHYRVDKLWEPHNKAICMFRYDKNINYYWSNKSFACGRIPHSMLGTKGEYTWIRIKHYGYANPKDIKRKYEWYKEQDPNGQWHQKEHLESIKDTEVSLMEWKDEL